MWKCRRKAGRIYHCRKRLENDGRNSLFIGIVKGYHKEQKEEKPVLRRGIPFRLEKINLVADGGKHEGVIRKL